MTEFIFLEKRGAMNAPQTGANFKEKVYLYNLTRICDKTMTNIHFIKLSFLVAKIQ